MYPGDLNHVSETFTPLLRTWACIFHICSIFVLLPALAFAFISILSTFCVLSLPTGSPLQKSNKKETNHNMTSITKIEIKESLSTKVFCWTSIRLHPKKGGNKSPLLCAGKGPEPVFSEFTSFCLDLLFLNHSFLFLYISLTLTSRSESSRSVGYAGTYRSAPMSHQVSGSWRSWTFLLMNKWEQFSAGGRLYIVQNSPLNCMEDNEERGYQKHK